MPKRQALAETNLKHRFCKEADEQFWKSAICGVSGVPSKDWWASKLITHCNTFCFSVGSLEKGEREEEGLSSLQKSGAFKS